MLIDYCEAARLHEQETGEARRELLRELQAEYNKPFLRQMLKEIYGKE